MSYLPGTYHRVTKVRVNPFRPFSNQVAGKPKVGYGEIFITHADVHGKEEETRITTFAPEDAATSPIPVEVVGLGTNVETEDTPDGSDPTDE